MRSQRYSPQFKEEAVRQITQRGYSVKEVSHPVIMRCYLSRELREDLVGKGMGHTRGRSYHVTRLDGFASQRIENGDIKNHLDTG